MGVASSIGLQLWCIYWGVTWLLSFYSSQHIPECFPISTFFPAFAMLLHLIEPLTTPTPGDAGWTTTMTSEQKRQLQEVMGTFSKAYR